ncbi:O-acetyl-ADP-ribose deacetylase (regulator of RNase III) [Planomicrobium koreense]|uniref:O-acetyl-ADP-ribose deacetylase (Regulator of RNase III) n=1 Tax=Planococcus koreensis TaxID=112331 RepID=A0A7W8CVL0_9BACL|nr:macro domain-containing protein [Planococcus koreensis]MBB5181204.1 O-acetyl-ADP-ribose deacetylase (regulator of RNase III) [Planococcus koreensis]
MPLEIIRNDLTKMHVDAIVNAANSNLQMGGGVCGAIFQGAGASEMQAACKEFGDCPTGNAVATPAFNLQARYVIHAVGPVWQGGGQGEERLLRSAYSTSLNLAQELGCESIAFPLISSGIYGYPKDQALEIAISEIRRFLQDHEMLVYLVVFDQKSFVISESLADSINSYIDEHYVEEMAVRYPRLEQEVILHEAEAKLPASLEDFLAHIDEPFSVRLLRFIDEKGMEDVETYKKANVDRKLFSKIRNSPSYTPMKKTIIAFAIALELDLDETEELLESAGYALSRSNKFDVIIEYFIVHEKYDIYEINEALFSFNQALLGA